MIPEALPDRVHLMLVPGDADDLRVALGEAHRRYSRRANFREGRRGYLWQGRFASVPMDEERQIAAARYLELNRVRAGLAAAPGRLQLSPPTISLAKSGAVGR